MDLLFVSAIVVTFLGVPITLQVLTLAWGARARARAWREAARAAGLSGVQESRGAIVGWAGRLQVRLSKYGSGPVYGTRITVSGPGLPSDFTVRPEDALLQTIRGGRELESGDNAFDRAAWVQGSPAVVRAVLDSGNRRSLQALFEGRLERPALSPFWATGRIDEGVLRVDVPEVVPPTASGRRASQMWSAPWMLERGLSAVGDDFVGGLSRLPEVLKVVVELGHRLQLPEDVPRRLADNLKTEPVAGVRWQVLTTLAREFPDHPATREALLAARDDPDAEVRLRAGISLGDEGRDVLLGIAGGEGALDATTAGAVKELAPHLTPAQLRPLLHNALRTRRVATAMACMVPLGQRGGPEAVAELARVLAVERGELAWAAARALATTGDPAAEAPLLRALEGGTRDVRLVAAVALGSVGTTAAVGPLRDAEKADAEMRRTVRQAIAEIQSRLPGAAPGQLSLAAGEPGQLSLASDERGRLSLAASARRAPNPAGYEAPGATTDPSGSGKRVPSA